jgi:hypothetical protein
MIKSIFNLGFVALLLGLVLTGTANATPSTQIWIPSSDIQKFASIHLNDDLYARPSKPTILVLGPTAGILPWQAIQAELGLDLFFQGNHELDKHPLYLHGKIGTPEDSMFKWSPAFAVGVYNVGFKKDLTNQNVGYALLAKTLPLLGRLSAGYFFGNDAVLVDEKGDAENHGLLLSWDRTISELTDKLWLAVDYQGSRSALGALNFGAAWTFAPNISVIVGYDHYLNHDIAGKDTFTVQVDIAFDLVTPPPPSPEPVSDADVPSSGKIK